MTKDDEILALTTGKGCLARSQGDEPVFILCARDKYAAATVRKWAEIVAFKHGHTAKTDEAYALADRMDAWRESHGGGKVPD